MNITKISRYSGLFIVLFLLAVVLPTADAQDFEYQDLRPFELGPKPTNIVPNGWLDRNARTTEDPTVWMPDENLRAAVEAELSALNPTLTLTKPNLTVLTSIHAAGSTDDYGINHSPITNLTGLEYATNLTWLDLQINNITNLTPLSGLRNLTDLDLTWNNITTTNLTSLSALVNLERLSISSNMNNGVSINDISALSSLTNMERLGLSGNAINDISVLSTLTSLTHLYVSGNNVSDISVLSNFSELRHLNLYDNNYDSTIALDITVIGNLMNLTILSLGRNSIDDIADLASLTNLTDLYLESNNITDFSILSDLTNLKRLSLTDNSIDDTDITDYLSGMTHLNMLFLGNNDITDLSDLSDMVNLQVLALEHNNISDISHLSDMVNLWLLVLKNNNISDISHLSDMVNLEQLFLRENSIRTIGALVELDSLEKVDLTVNPVWDNNTNRNTLADLYARSVEVLIDDLVPPGGIGPVVEPGVSFNVPSLPQSDPFDVDVVFTEEVYGFEQAELDLNPSTIASITSTEFTTTDNISYTATITPSSSGSLTFSVAAGVARDAAYDLNTAGTSNSVPIDIDAPYVVSITVPEGTQSVPFDVSVVFNEEVLDFVKGDLTLGGTGTAKITDFDATDAPTYTVEITPVIDGDIIFSVAAGVATDTAGNENTATTRTWTVPVDVPEPEVSVVVPSGVQNDSFEVSFVFNESVSDFDENDVDLGGTPATITQWTPDSTNPMRYVAIVTPTNTTPGDVTINVPAGAVTNDTGTPNNATTQTVSVDLPPNVSVTVPSDIQYEPFDVSVVFTEAVSDFDNTDLVLDPPEIATVVFTPTTDNITYTATITPITYGDITFSVDTGVATDNTANLQNTAALPRTVAVDLFVEIPDLNLLRTLRNTLGLDANESVTESQMASLTSIRYEGQNRRSTRRIQDLTGLEYATNLQTLNVRGNRITDITPLANLTNLTDLNLGNNRHISTISELTELTNLEVLSLWKNNIEHISGGVFENLTMLTFLTLRDNPIINTAANRETRDILQQRPGLDFRIDSFVDDETDPNVEISVTSGVQNDAFEVTFTFTEPISGFDASDIVLGGLSAEITDPQQDSVDEQLYTSTITPTETVSGNITIDIPEDAVTDAAGNGSTAATTLLVAVDLPPQVSFNIPSRPQYGEFKVKIIFSESVTGFIQEDIALGGTATAQIEMLSGQSTSVYNIRITPTLKGDLTISVPAGVATDEGNNPNTTATSDLVSVDLDFVIEFPDANLAREIRHTLDLDDDEDITKTQMLRLVYYASRSPNHEKISDLSGFEHATNAKRLNFYNNSITDFTALEELPELRELNLSSNGITDVTGLVNLTNINYVNLRFNQITDVSPLETMTGLQGISIWGNPLLDTSPFYRMIYSPQAALTYVDIRVSQYPPWDVNEDGSVDATDSALVTAALGQTGNAIVDSRTDVNSDGTVDQNDLTLVTDHISADEASPSNSGLFAVLDQETLQGLDRGMLESYLNTLRAESDGSLKYKRAIAILEGVLAITRPKQTQLLANYPNPFNPETWIPYHLANASNVRITIYDVSGTVVRQLDLGLQREGYYTSQSRAAYWDGKNNVGESVASGIYFYQLEADNVSLLQKMVILK